MLISKASLSRSCSVDVTIERRNWDIGRQYFGVSTERCKVRHCRWRVSDLTDCMWVVQVDTRIPKPCGLQVDHWGNCVVNYKRGSLMKRLKWRNRSGNCVGTRPKIKSKLNTMKMLYNLKWPLYSYLCFIVLIN